LLDRFAHADPVLVDPEVFEVTAKEVAKLASPRPKRDKDDKPARKPAKQPERFKRIARKLYLEAAIEWARRGAQPGALSGIREANELAPALQYETAPIHLAVGDYAGALAALRSAVDNLNSYRPPVRVRILLNAGLAHAANRDYRAAFDAAKRAHQIGTASLQPQTDTAIQNDLRSIVNETDRVAVAWLWAATALKIGRIKEVQDAFGWPADGSEDQPNDSSKALGPFDVLRSWLALLSKPSEDDRRPLRWKALMTNVPAPAVLPAVMFVVGSAVPMSTSDVDVWLDRIFHQEHRDQVGRAALARAEVARWHDDPRWAKIWRDRATAIMGLSTTYETAVLAQIAELR